MPSSIVEVFLTADDAIRNSALIVRKGPRDKEFHFQDWFKARLSETSLNYKENGRNTYPDFELPDSKEGIEVKGLASPGRVKDFDANSRMPTGRHNDLDVFYAFGRYPSDPDSNSYELIDLVICHGDFFSADHDYEHENKSFKEFGSYGDVLVRDRKMYVVPTPFGLLEGVEDHTTLILPAAMRTDDARLRLIGSFSRTEAARIVVDYRFDLGSNALIPGLEDNPTGGFEHEFVAYCAVEDDDRAVRLRQS